MEIKIKEWNVNFGSDKDAEICKFAKEYINDTDIIVFTEVIDIDEKKWDINSLPDICHLEIITSEGKLTNVIGTRVRIDGGSDAD